MGAGQCLSWQLALDLARGLLREVQCVWAVAAAELQEIVSAESGSVLLFGHTYQRAFRIGSKSFVPFVALCNFCTTPCKIKRWVRKYPSSVRASLGWQWLGSSVDGGALFPLFHSLNSMQIILEDHWGTEHNLAIPGGSIHALLCNFLNIHSDFSVSVRPKLLLGEALLGCFLELS